MHINVPKTFHMNYHVKAKHTNVPKTFHITFHINYHVKIKHTNWNYD
jgi:hypothetical protein